MAATDVQGMLVRIEATTAQLRQEMLRGDSAVGQSADSIDKSLSRVDKAFDRTGANAGGLQSAISSAFGAVSIATAGAVAGLVAIATSTLEYAKEVKNLAALSNTSVEDFQRLAYAARTVGVEQDKLADILKDTNDRVGEFLQRGGGEMADFFKEIAPRVGVTAEQFARLSGPQALQLYYSSLEKAGLNQQQVTTYMESMADEATALIPLLKDSGKAFQELGDRGQYAGGILSGLDIERMVQVNQSIVDLKASFTGVTRQLVSGMLPGIESVTQRLQSMSDNGGARALGEAIGFLAENINLVIAALGARSAAAFAGYIAGMAKAAAASISSEVAATRQAAATLQVAIAQQRAAETATILAAREAVAARGTAVQTEMAIQHAAARQTEAAAIARVAAAQAGLRSVAGTVMGILGGPVGLAALALGAGAAFLTMSSNASAASVSVEQLKRPIQELRQEFIALNKDQRQALLVTTMRQQQQATEDADGAFKDLLGTIKQQAGATIAGRITQELQSARQSGKGLDDTLTDLQKRRIIPESAMGDLRVAAGNLDTLDSKSRKLAQTQAVYSKELNANTESQKKNTDQNQAGINTATQQLQTLQKQLNTLKDKTTLEAAERVIAENNIDTQGELAQQLRQVARDIDAQKDAKKADTQATKDATTEQTKLNQQLKEAADGYKQLKQQFDPAGAAQDDFAKKTAELELLHKNGKLTQEQYAQGVSWLKQQFDTAIASANGLSEALKYQADLERQLANAKAQYDLDAASVGMGDQEAQRLQARLQLEQQTNDRVLQLRTELATATTEKQRQELEKQIALTQEYGAKQADAMVEGYKKVDQAQADWSNGAQAAWKNYRDNTANVAGQTKDLFDDMFRGAEDALTEFVKTGKLSFKDLADSIVEDLIRIQIRKLMVAAIDKATSSSSSFLSGAGSMFQQAKGGAWSGGVQKFAKGGSFTNGLFDQPTRFSMADGGTGELGEAGPEAVMPLTRGPDGSLGVMAHGGGGSQTTVDMGGITQHFSFNSQNDAALQSMLARAAEQGAKAGYQAVAKDFSTNGPLRRMLG